MSENRIISFIHEIRTLDRRWKNLTADQKRSVIETLNGDADEPSVLKANPQGKENEMKHITVKRTTRPPKKFGCEYTASLITDTGKGIEKREYYGSTAGDALVRLAQNHDITGIETRIEQ